MKIRRLSIIGLGLMGGSLAIAARKSITGCEITGYDLSKQACESARRRRIVHHVAGSIPHAARHADLVIIATPVDACRKILPEIARCVRESAIVTDVCSTKRSIMAMATKLPILSKRFVGSHPMAGSTQSGIEHADATIFPKSLCILTSGRDTGRAAVAAVRRFWKKLGMRTVQMPADRHDRVVALASHLPQIVASTLMAVQSDESMAVAGRGLVDTTRLAGSDGELWAQILTDNRDGVTKAIKALRKHLDRLEAAVRKDRATTIIRMFRKAQRARMRLR